MNFTQYLLQNKYDDLYRYIFNYESIYLFRVQLFITSAPNAAF